MIAHEELEALFNTKESLDFAMREAGCGLFSLESLRRMTALELLCLLAPNHIGFMFAPPLDKETQ